MHLCKMTILSPQSDLGTFCTFIVQSGNERKERCVFVDNIDLTSYRLALAPTLVFSDGLPLPPVENRYHIQHPLTTVDSLLEEIFQEKVTYQSRAGLPPRPKQPRSFCTIL